MNYATRSILAIDSTPFGESLSLVPAMRALRASYPKSILVAAAPTGLCELLVDCCLVDDVMPLGVIKSQDNAASGTVRRLWRFFKGSRHHNFDLVLDFSPRFETQLVSRLFSRARVLTPSRATRALDLLLELGGVRRSTKQANSSKHENVLRRVGVELNDSRIAPGTPAEEDAQFEKRLEKSGSRGGELLVLLYSSNANGPRGWPIDAFADIGTRLANNFGARIIAADEPSDDAFTRSVGQWLPAGSIKLVEPRALELFAAIGRSSIVITDESSIAQIAGELSTPAIEIANAFSILGGSSASHRVAQAATRRHVSVDEVFDLASAMIQENRSPSLFHRS